MLTRRQIAALPISALGMGIASEAVAQGLFINPLEERQLGIQGHPQAILRDGGVYGKESVSRLIRSLGQEAANSVARHPDQFVITTLNNSSFNAYARLGGFLYVHAGIIPWLNDEAELMALLGHECGHAVNRHMARSIARQNVSERLVKLSALRRGQTAQGVKENQVEAWLAIKKYGRDQEFQADDVAMLAVARTGRDPEGTVRLLRKLMQWNDLHRKLNPTAKEPDPYSASHPPSVDRVARSQQLLVQSGYKADTNTAFQDRYYSAINGMVVPKSSLTLGRPYRVDVRTVKSGDTVASLARQMALPALIKEDGFRMSNGLAPDDTLTPGQPVKVFTSI